MNIEEIYKNSAANTLISLGFTTKTAEDVSKGMVNFTKKASMFNFSDSPYGGNGISLSSIVLPLLSAAGVAYISYNAGAEGNKNKSALTNIKNYIGKNLDKIMRIEKPRPFFDYMKYMPRTLGGE